MEFLSWVFFGPAKLVAALPYSGIGIAIALIATQAWLTIRKGKQFNREFFREAPVLSGLLWMIFNLYELQLAAVIMQNKFAGTLRMDLIILVPILYVISVAGVLSIRAQLVEARAGP